MTWAELNESILLINGYLGFDIVSWITIGLVLNLVGIIASVFIYASPVMDLIDKDPANALYLEGMINKLRELRKINFLVIFNYILPYYMLYKALMSYFIIKVNYNGTLESFARILAKAIKYDIGCTYKINN